MRLSLRSMQQARKDKKLKAKILREADAEVQQATQELKIELEKHGLSIPKK